MPYIVYTKTTVFLRIGISATNLQKNVHFVRPHISERGNTSTNF